jgi:hypothetical protein
MYLNAQDAESYAGNFYLYVHQGEKSLSADLPDAIRVVSDSSASITAMHSLLETVC